MIDQLNSKYSFLIIPSWTDLLGIPDLGTYLNQKVTKIHNDCVIFFTGVEYSLREERGNLFYLFGLGYYSLRFNLEGGGKPILDGKTLTGLILTDEIYNKMITSDQVSLGNELDIIISDKGIKFPVDLSDKNNLESIKSALLSKVFLPYKDTILDFVQKIQDPNIYKVKDQGQKLLTTHWDNYNEIIVSKKMEMYPFDNYMKATAGLKGIYFGADQHLEKVLSPSNIEAINNNSIELKRFYSNVEFDSSYVYSIIENVSALFQNERIRNEQERLEKERLERERSERERLESERSERERLEKERIEKERLREKNERLKQEHIKMEAFRKEQEKIHKEREKIRKESDILAQDEFKVEQAELQDEFFEDEIIKNQVLAARKITLDDKWKSEVKRKRKEEKQQLHTITYQEKSKIITFKHKTLGTYKFSMETWKIFQILLGMPFEDEEFNEAINRDDKKIAKLIKKHIKEELIEVVVTSPQKKKKRGDEHLRLFWRLSKKGENIALLILDWLNKYQTKI